MKIKMSGGIAAVVIAAMAMVIAVPANAGDTQRGPRGPRGFRGPVGPQGPVGAQGAAGAQGPAGPSNAYVASSSSTSLGVGFTTLASVAVPDAGSYLVTFSTCLNSSDTAQDATCRVTASTGSWTAQPLAIDALTATATDNYPISATGWITTAGAVTLALQCGVTTGTANANQSRLTALQVGSIT